MVLCSTSETAEDVLQKKKNLSSVRIYSDGKKIFENQAQESYQLFHRSDQIQLVEVIALPHEKTGYQEFEFLRKTFKCNPERCLKSRTECLLQYPPGQFLDIEEKLKQWTPSSKVNFPLGQALVLALDGNGKARKLLSEKSIRTSATEKKEIQRYRSIWRKAVKHRCYNSI